MLSFYYFPMKNDTAGNVTEQECENPLKGLIYFIIFCLSFVIKIFSDKNYNSYFL